MNLLIETSPQQYYQELTQVVAEIMNADYLPVDDATKIR